MGGIEKQALGIIADENTVSHCNIACHDSGKKFQNCPDYCQYWPVFAHFFDPSEASLGCILCEIQEFMVVSVIVLQYLQFLLYFLILNIAPLNIR